MASHLLYNEVSYFLQLNARQTSAATSEAQTVTVKVIGATARALAPTIWMSWPVVSPPNIAVWSWF